MLVSKHNAQIPAYPSPAIQHKHVPYRTVLPYVLSYVHVQKTRLLDQTGIVNPKVQKVTIYYFLKEKYICRQGVNFWFKKCIESKLSKLSKLSNLSKLSAPRNKMITIQCELEYFGIELKR